MNNNKNAFFIAEDLGNGKISLKVNGKGKDLIELFANVINNSPEMRLCIEMALVSVMAQENEDEQENDDQLIEMLKGMKIGLA